VECIPVLMGDAAHRTDAELLGGEFRTFGASALHGQRCESCTAMLRQHGRPGVHACGGCGVAFLAGSNVSAEPTTIGGPRRTFCACCREFIDDAIRSSSGEIVPGYDMEGHAINLKLSCELPMAKSSHRVTRTQFHLWKILRRNSSGPGLRREPPLFLDRQVRQDSPTGTPVPGRPGIPPPLRVTTSTILNGKSWVPGSPLQGNEGSVP
jgi:hypothetical protein